jgi:hypothetical protein
MIVLSDVGREGGVPTEINTSGEEASMECSLKGVWEPKDSKYLSYQAKITGLPPDMVAA